MSDHFAIEGPAVISFSGGRTSGLMLRRCLDAGLQPHVFVVFADTGKERQETYDFVRECASRWGVEIHWVARDKGEYATPFDKLIVDRGFLPNPVMRFCTTELKIRPMKAFMMARGYEHWTNVVGLRADEPSRVSRMRATNAAGKDRWDVAMPLAEAGVTVADVAEFWKGQRFDLRLQPHEGNCDLCLAAETEVVTADGIRTIKELSGTTAELLVPKMARGFSSEVGTFTSAPVRSFGVQRLWRVLLAGHGRSKKEVFATAEHRWFLQRSTQRPPPVSTMELREGDKLRNLTRSPIGSERGGRSQIGALHGFIFGDGSVKHGNRPGGLNLFAGKDEVFRPFFTALCGPGVPMKENKGWYFYGFPHAWKRLPDIRESRHYLLGFLSGWFAADGCVSEDGNCILASARRENLQFARSLCAVLGVQYSPITHQDRYVKPPGGRARHHRIFTININRHALPLNFFWLKHHRARIKSNAVKQVRRYGWTVVSAEETDRVEEVFCAVVDGVGAFGLADGLMTGNCYLKSRAKKERIIRDHPELADWWIAKEKLIGARFRATGPSYEEMATYQRRQLTMFQEPAAACATEEIDDLGDCICSD